MKASRTTVIACPVERIDLVDWLENLSDRDYQACSRSHRAAGAFREDGKLGTVNVESIGGHLLIQHYLAAESLPHHVVMHSTRTRMYIMHLIPATVEVIWTLDVEPAGDADTLFRCLIEVRLRPFLGIVATLALLQLFLRWHTEEEAPLFAKDIARKFCAKA